MPPYISSSSRSRLGGSRDVFSFATEELTQMQTQQRDERKEIPSSFINISAMKLAKSTSKASLKEKISGFRRPHSAKKTNEYASPFSKARLGQNSASRKFKKTESGGSASNNRNSNTSFNRYHGTDAGVKTAWLDNLRNTTEYKVPAHAPRAKRFRDQEQKQKDSYARNAISCRSRHSMEASPKSNHQAERKRIQSLVSSMNWDAMGKPDLYIFGKELGKGSFGVVKLAHHKITGHKVAIKVYDKTKFKKSSQIKRCRQEIDLMGKLNSNCVSHLFEAFENGKKMFLVMEALSGGNLCTYVKSKKYLKEKEALSIFSQIARAIDYLHNTAGVVHRDIKLENILFTSRRRVKLADFGFSVFAAENDENVERIGPNGPRKYLKSFCGTPSYMAPEIIRKKGYEGFPVDIWSLGVVFYAMLFGRFPFRAKNHDELYKFILTGKYSIPESLADAVSQTAKDLLARMICLDVRNRAIVGDLLAARTVEIACRDAKESLSASGFSNSKGSSCYSTDGRPLHLVSKDPKDDLDEALLKQLVKFGFSYHRLRRHIINMDRNHISATYYLLRMKQARKGRK